MQKSNVDKTLYFANVMSDLKNRLNLTYGDITLLIQDGKMIAYILDGYDYYHMYADDVAVTDVIERFGLDRQTV